MEINKYLEALGFKDVTDNKPISFSECLGEFFDSIYPYSKRFYKQEAYITTELKVGNCHNIVFISVICYYPKGLEKFEVCAHKNYIDNMFTQTFNAVKQLIKEKYMNAITKRH